MQIALWACEGVLGTNVVLMRTVHAQVEALVRGRLGFTDADIARAYADVAPLCTVNAASLCTQWRSKRRRSEQSFW